MLADAYPATFDIKQYIEQQTWSNYSVIIPF